LCAVRHSSFYAFSSSKRLCRLPDQVIRILGNDKVVPLAEHAKKLQ
jgi:hypothetical protein